MNKVHGFAEKIPVCPFGNLTTNPETVPGEILQSCGLKIPHIRCGVERVQAVGSSFKQVMHDGFNYPSLLPTPLL